MMSFTIYSIGDSTFLEQILIGIAMITGAGDLEKAVMIGMLFGVLIICVKSLLQGAKQIEFQQVFVCWVCYMCFFGPATVVTIEDAYDGNVRVVANVPLGIGFTGGVISNVGYTVTDLFTTGFSIIAPSITRTEFAESLKLLNDTRRNLDKSGIYVAMNDAMGGGSVDIRKSWDNYIRECTLTKIDLGLVSVESMMTGKVTEVLPFMSSLYGTRIYLNPGEIDGEEYTCSEGWFYLSASLDSISDMRVQQAISAAIGLNRPDIGQATSRIQDSIQALGQASTSANEYLKASILEPLYNDAVVGKYKDMLDFGSAVMVNQAIQQRNTQWATEQSMFVTVARPMMAFFEGFVYSLTPIMAMLMVMGSFGMGLLIKYFLTVLWIQLWMPVLAVVNLYIHVISTNKIAQLNLPGLDSFYAINTAGEILQNWIATGGMLAASTPIISLFIVTGSTYAFTSLAGRVNGSDHINEKLSSPDALQSGPLVSMMPMHSGNSFSGIQKTGTENLNSSMNFGDAVSSGISSASAIQQSKSDAFKQEVSRGVTEGGSTQQQSQRLQSLGRSVSSMGTKQSQMIDSKAREIGKQYGLSESTIDAIKGALTLSAMGGAGAKGTGLQGALSAALSADKSNTASEGGRLDSVMRAVQGATFSTSDSQALTSGLTHQAVDSGSNSFTKSWSDSSSNLVAKSAQESIAATESLTSLQSMQSSLGQQTSTDMKTLGGAISASPEAESRLNNAVQNAPQAVRQEAIALENRFANSYNMDRNVARNAAQLQALTNSSNYANGNGSAGLAEGMRIIGQATGRSLDFTGDPNRNSGLKEQTPTGVNTDEIRSRVAGAPEFNDGKLSSVTTQAQRQPGGPSSVVADHQSRTGTLVKNGNRALEGVANEQSDFIKDQIINKSSSTSFAQRDMGTLDQIKDLSSSFMEFGKSTASNIQTSNDQNDRILADPKGEGIKQFQEDFKNRSTGERAVGYLGNTLLGVSAKATNAFNEWRTGKSSFSDHTKNMSIEETGAFMAQGLAQAYSGGATTAARFLDDHKSEMKGLTKRFAQEKHGLPGYQAEIFASAKFNDQAGLDAGYKGLRESLAQRDSSGEILRNSSGEAILSEKDNRFALSMYKDIYNAGVHQGSKDGQSGPILKDVKAWNATQNTPGK